MVESQNGCYDLMIVLVLHISVIINGMKKNCLASFALLSVFVAVFSMCQVFILETRRGVRFVPGESQMMTRASMWNPN